MQNYKSKFKILKICVIVLILNFLFLIFNLSWVNAQQVNLALSPPIITAHMKPGKSILIAYTLENHGDPTVMTVKMLPFEPKDNSGNIKLKGMFEGPVQFNLDNANLQLNIPFFMQTSQKQQLLLRIKVPDEAQQGDYYYTLLAETQTPPTFEGVFSSRAKATIGSNIIITVTSTGQLEMNTRVALFDIIGRYSIDLFGKKTKIIDSSDSVPVVLMIQNQGKNFVSAEGSITLQGSLKTKANYDIVPQNILAQSQRIMKTSTAQPNCDESEKIVLYCKQPVTSVITGFFLGIYKLSATINYGENSPTVFASTTFFAFPIKIFLGLLIASCIILLILTRKKEDE